MIQFKIIHNYFFENNIHSACFESIAKQENSMIVVLNDESLRE